MNSRAEDTDVVELRKQLQAVTAERDAQRVEIQDLKKELSYAYGSQENLLLELQEKGELIEELYLSMSDKNKSVGALVERAVRQTTRHAITEMMDSRKQTQELIQENEALQKELDRVASEKDIFKEALVIVRKSVDVTDDKVSDQPRSLADRRNRSHLSLLTNLNAGKSSGSKSCGDKPNFSQTPQPGR